MTNLPDDVVANVARAILHQKGFGFYTDPMEGGQDAYDISVEAIEEARASLEAARYGEMWDCLQRLVTRVQLEIKCGKVDLSFACPCLEQAHALLSSIGASHD